MVAVLAVILGSKCIFITVDGINMAKKSQIVLCIPTSLNSRQAITSALVDKYGTDYLFLGRLLRSNVDQQSCTIDICDRDSSLVHNFALMGQNKIDVATLADIEQHQKIIYLTSTETNYENCRLLAKLGQIFLRTSGLGLRNGWQIIILMMYLMSILYM